MQGATANRLQTLLGRLDRRVVYLGLFVLTLLPLVGGWSLPLYVTEPPQRLYAAAEQLTGSGVSLVGLAALDSDAQPNYNRDVAERLVGLGAHVAAMTPGELADWIARKIL